MWLVRGGGDSGVHVAGGAAVAADPDVSRAGVEKVPSARTATLVEQRERPPARSLQLDTQSVHCLGRMTRCSTRGQQHPLRWPQEL